MSEHSMPLAGFEARQAVAEAGASACPSEQARLEPADVGDGMNRARAPARRAEAPVIPALSILAAAMIASALWRIALSFGHMLWLDELYTTTLIGAPSLGHLWDAALRGVDGNPPLYLSLAWMLTSTLRVDPEQVLRPLNLLALALTAVLVYRLGRRMAAPVSVAAILAVLPALDGTVTFALLEMRTYALYLLLVTATLSATLGVVDRPRPGRTVLLAGIGVLATLAHSFGGFYVLATLGAAGLVCLGGIAWDNLRDPASLSLEAERGSEGLPARPRSAGRDRRAMVALALAAAPAAVTLAGWVVLSLPAQMAVATPYGWISQPDGAELLKALTGSGLLSLTLLGGLLVVLGGAAARGGLDPRPWIARRDLAALYAALAAYAVLTLAGWAGSQVVTPFFVPRYFIPNLLVAALILVPAAEAVRRGVGRGGTTAGMVACAVLGVWNVARDEPRNAIPCRGADGSFLEAAAALGGLPVVVESPHAWMPRSRYAPNQTTLYPLDWNVVLDRPTQARNNAMDFHIMEILRGWAPARSALATGVLTTEEILARNERFLLLDEDGRGWFDELRARTSVSATLIAEGARCRLWKVSRVP